MIKLTKERWDYLKSQPYYEKDVKKLLELISTMSEYEVVEFWHWYAQSKCMTWADIPESRDEMALILGQYLLFNIKSLEDLVRIAGDIYDKTINIFTDGSYHELKNVGKWAFITVENDKILFQNSGLITDKNWLTGRQIACECQAVIEGLIWAKNNNYKAKLHVDYLGLICWVNDIWGEKPWKTNKEYTILYREKVLEMRENIVDFVKIKSHSGHALNNAVDQLAKIN